MRGGAKCAGQGDGIPEGVPWFKIREWATDHGVVARSSNYKLYASLSARMMSVMRRFFTHQEVYSIDECSLSLQDSAQSKRIGEANMTTADTESSEKPQTSRTPSPSRLDDLTQRCLRMRTTVFKAWAFPYQSA